MRGKSLASGESARRHSPPRNRSSLPLPPDYRPPLEPAAPSAHPPRKTHTSRQRQAAAPPPVHQPPVWKKPPCSSGKHMETRSLPAHPPRTPTAPPPALLGRHRCPTSASPTHRTGSAPPTDRRRPLLPQIPASPSVAAAASASAAGPENHRRKRPRPSARRAAAPAPPPCPRAGPSATRAARGGFPPPRSTPLRQVRTSATPPPSQATAPAGPATTRVP